MAAIKKSNAPRSRFQPIKKQYKIFDLTVQTEREEFSHSLVQDTFALIKIPNQYKSSLLNLLDIFERLFKSNKSLECEEQRQYVGYTSTTHLKQSLWLYLDYKNQTLFPKIKNDKSVLSQNNNLKTVYDSFRNYTAIANDAIHAILEYQCKDRKSYIQCWNNLFPKNKMSETKENSVDNNDCKTDQNYPESAVYHHYRKSEEISLENLAVIQYFGDKNKKTKKGLLEKLKSKSNDSNEMKQNMQIPCEEHMDYGLVTVIMANEPGLQVRDIMNFEWIDIEDIISTHNLNRKDVLVVISGLTLGTLLHDRVSCYHSVKNSFRSNDRLSFPLFCYADPNGIIDTSMIKPTFDYKIRLSDNKKLNCAQYLAKNMHPSVNF